MTDFEREFARIGIRLRREGLAGANSGNLSVKNGDRFLITRTGSFLDEPGEPVSVPMQGAIPKEASSESGLHREVYRNASHLAVVHAHPPYAVALSLCGAQEIIPMDSEGEMFCPRIPVVTGAPGSDEMARNVADALSRGTAVLVKGHGSITAGMSLDEAYVLTSLVEHSCKVLMFLRQWR